MTVESDDRGAKMKQRRKIGDLREGRG